MKKTFLTIALVSVSSIGLNAQHQEIINIVKSKYAPDNRTAIFEIRESQRGDTTILEGNVDNINAKEALTQEFNNSGLVVSNKINTLPDSSISKKWALVSVPFAHLRYNAGHESELVSQALMGTPLKILEAKNGWYRVQTPDNYISWVINNSVTEIADSELQTWKDSQRYIVTSIYCNMYSDTKANDVVSTLVLNDILTCEGKKGKFLLLSTPDGRKGFVKSSDVEPLDKWVNQKFNSNLITNTAKQLMGSTYTWGGTTTKGVDCSGLTKTAYFANGIILQRDASQQVLYGKKISPAQWKSAEEGDLLYFGTKSGRVTHTAIYLKDGKYIHSSGRVKVNSVNPNSSDYLSTPFISINRIEGNVDTSGITSVKNHPWYFNK